MKVSDLEGTIAGYRDALTVKRVFGEAYEKNGVTVIPAATVLGGGGGGQGENPQAGETASGAGTGFGLIARPSGAYVIRGDEVTWQPAVDVNRIAAMAFAFLTLRVVLGRRRRRR